MTADVESGKRGSIYSFSVVHRGVGERFKAVTPYVLALVDLEGGERILTNIVDSPVEHLAIGAEVEAVQGKDPEGRPLAQFALTGVGE